MRASDPRTATITTTDTSPVTSRLTYSMVAWPADSWNSWGASLPSAQVGQSGQPRPEPVTRTAPPDTMIAASRTSATNVTRR